VSRVRTNHEAGRGRERPSAATPRSVLAWRVAAVACTLLFAALLVWLYGVRTTLVWTAAMAGFLAVLYAATTPLRARQRRAWREMGLGPDGRPLAEEIEERAAGDGDGDADEDEEDMR